MKDYFFKISKVDKILVKHNIDNYEVFYSNQFNYYGLPIILILMWGLPLFNIFWFRYLFGLYFIILFFSGNYFHSSFALTDKEFIVINPNFPFNKYLSFNLSQIQSIDIFPAKDKWYINLFNPMVGYSIILQTFDNKEYNIRCMLEIDDDFSETVNPNSTIDDFYRSLENKGLVVNINYW